jgi:aryl-alcohol dehydrogenase-like predicted oxidoreductase
MEAAWQAGITHWDTAIAYGSGESETLCGNFLRRNRSSAFIATKGSAGKRPQGLVRSLYRSLDNLGTEYIDRFYIHFPKTGVDMRPHMDLLERERSKGVVRSIGVSNFSVEQMEEVSEAGHIDACQCGYSLLWRAPEREVIPYCLEHGVDIVAYSSLALGILTGKFDRRPELPMTDVRNRAVLFQDDTWPHVENACRVLKALAAREARPLQHLAIQWLNRRPGVSSILFGARNRQQVEENAGALDGSPVDDILEAMTEISDELHEHYPPETNIFRWYP